MNREINLKPWNQVCLITKYEHHTLINNATVLIENGGDYFYIHDDIEKVIDVSQMPEYIKGDWINYNKKPINISVLNQMIKDYEKGRQNLLQDRGTMYEYKEPTDDELEDLINLLKSLRRDLIINKVI
jgi:hypothetical protein